MLYTIIMNTHTQTLLSSWTPDMSFTKEEIIDVDVLSVLCKSDDLSNDDHQKLRAIKRKLIRGRYLESTYKLGKNIKAEDENLGRLCVLRGLGLQSLPRQIRSALAQANYWDVDIVSCHPTLAVQLCQKYGITCNQQQHFVENRSRFREELADHLQVEEGRVKERINALYFGYESACNGMPEFFTTLQNEISKSRDLIINHPDWSDQVKFLKGKENRAGRSFSYILQTIERSCLLELDRSANRNKRSLDVFIHDGGLIRKVENEKVFPDALLRTFEMDIERTTGYKVKLAVKPLTTDLEVSQTNDAVYHEMKVQFEADVAHINTPPTFIRSHDKEIVMLNRTQLEHIYAHMKIDEASFLEKWVHDKNKRNYESMVFLPGLEPPPDRLNIFCGFPFEPKEGDVSRFLELIDMVCNHQKNAVEYMLDWLAHLIQKPYEKHEVSIIVQGLKGSGKDSPFDKFGELLGKMFFNTGTPENDVFSSFNGMLKHNLLVKMEEGNFQTNKNNEPKLKSMISAKKVAIQEKNKDQINYDNYSRFIITTNEEIPIHITPDERRWFLVKTSDENRGKRDFWNDTWRVFSDPLYNSYLMHYFMNRDISQFAPREYPDTQYNDEVLGAFTPEHADYFRQWIQRQDDPDIPFKAQHYQILEKINELSKFKRSDRWLHKAMKEHYTGVIEKSNPKNKVYYQFKTEDMITRLKEKGWWIDV